jgi:hypothetical protein
MVDPAHLRAWWGKKQGLDSSLSGAAPDEILQKSGWARSVGGSNPYLTFFARGGVSRAEADQAAADLKIHELPAARGCTYIVPAEDFALALRAGQNFGEEAEIQIAVKHLGVTEKEIERLMQRVTDALKSGAKDPRQLKEILGDAVRNLGDAGKKRGVTTTLPLALGRLQSHGKIRRVPIGGRLDQQRYSYVLWSPSPLEKWKVDKEKAYEKLAERYFRWIGPATLQDFQAFAGLTLKATKAAVENLKLVPIEKDHPFLILSDEIDSFQRFKTPKRPDYSLVSGLDSILLHRRDLTPLLEKKDADRLIGQSKVNSLRDLPNHAIVDRGRVVGLWEYEPSSDRIVAQSFVPRDKSLESAIKKMEDFIRKELGDAKSFSLDSPESRKPRIAALKKG